MISECHFVLSVFWSLATSFDRDAETEKTEHTLLPSIPQDRRKIHVLHGLGGIGKTQKLQERYSAIQWLNGNSKDSLVKSLAEYTTYVCIDCTLKFLPLIWYSHASAVGPAYAEPKCSLHEDALHFWTVFNAVLIEYLLFSVLYWWAFYPKSRKWTAGHLAIPMSCFAAVLMASVS